MSKLPLSYLAAAIAIAVVTFPSYATTNTLDNVDEYINGREKVCVYSDGNRTETATVSRASSCPSKKTFH